MQVQDRTTRVERTSNGHERYDPTVMPPVRIFLQPIAPPSILGLYGFAGATLMVGLNLAGVFGSATSGFFLFPFAAIFGGLAQFLAGMWSYRARDGLATAMHGTWGSFWMGYGILQFMFAAGIVTQPTGAFPELGWWFIVLAAITWMGAWAAVPVNGALTGVLVFLAAGSTASAIAFINGSPVATSIGGWLFFISAVIAWYLASAMMLAGTYKRPVLHTGKYHTLEETPVEYIYGQPGVKVGQ